MLQGWVFGGLVRRLTLSLVSASHSRPFPDMRWPAHVRPETSYKKTKIRAELDE